MMTGANLRPLWLLTSCNTCIVFINWALGEICTQFQEKKTPIHFATLGAIYIGLVQRGMYTIWWKASCTLTSVAKDAWYCLYRLQSSMGYVRNSRKNNYALQ